MRHLGDITKINGARIDPVDVITFGAPCQDLSVAGKRAGMKHESMGDDETTRSGLFFEAVRIIKEMRENDRRNGRTDEFIRCRYAIYENVPGALSSNRGKDWQAVLTEIIKIVEPETPVLPETGKGGWPKAGCIYDELGRWSIAWRVHDAQFWGVPQRRKRIALVADFGGLSAPEVQFERKSLSWYYEPCEEAGKGSPAGIGGGSDRTGDERIACANPWDPQSERMYYGDGAWHSLNANSGGGQNRDSVFCLQGNGIDRADTAGCNGRGWCKDVSYTLNTIDRPAVVYENHGQDSRYKPLGDTCETVSAKYGMGGNNQPLVVEPIVLEINQNHAVISRNGISPTLPAAMGLGGGYVPMVTTYDDSSISYGFKPRQGANAGSIGYGEEIAPTLSTDAHCGGGVMTNKAICIGNGQINMATNITEEVSQTLNCMHDPMAVLCFQNTGHGWWNESEVAATLRTPCGGDSVKANLVAAVDCRNATENTYINGTLQAKEQGQNLNSNNVIRIGSVVRHLTPLECTRLQGFPDGWVDIGEWTDSKGKKHKDADSPKYKALGNSIALPYWQYLARRICAQYERPVTMGSLFDGIGGFPLVFARCGAIPMWASEIEEFPIAVTKLRFGED